MTSLPWQTSLQADNVEHFAHLVKQVLTQFLSDMSLELTFALDETHVMPLLIFWQKH